MVEDTMLVRQSKRGKDTPARTRTTAGSTWSAVLQDRELSHLAKRSELTILCRDRKTREVRPGPFGTESRSTMVVLRQRLILAIVEGRSPANKKVQGPAVFHSDRIISGSGSPR